MDWTLAESKDLMDVVQALATTVGLVVAAIWAYRRYVIQAERWPHVATSAEIHFIGKQQGQWLVELVALLENKGKVEHRLVDFTFDLNGLSAQARLLPDKRWGGQVNFPLDICEGSFLPEHLAFFSVGPGVTARYSFLASIPENVSFVLLHCGFRYLDRVAYSHSMECTCKVPDGQA